MRVIFIDGSQMVGKSTLIKGLEEKYGFETYKFPFSEYTSALGLKSKEELRGFQAGKDLSALYWLSQFSDTDKTIIVDRGPMSTAYYSIACDRMTYLQTDRFIQELAKFGQDFTYIFITAKNRPDGMKRDKKDGFDDLRRGEAKAGVLNYLKGLSEEFDLNLIHFENDFSIPIEENIKNLYNLIRL